MAQCSEDGGLGGATGIPVRILTDSSVGVGAGCRWAWDWRSPYAHCTSSSGRGWQLRRGISATSLLECICIGNVSMVGVGVHSCLQQWHSGLHIHTHTGGKGQRRSTCVQACRQSNLEGFCGQSNLEGFRGQSNLKGFHGQRGTGEGAVEGECGWAGVHQQKLFCWSSLMIWHSLLAWEL